MSEQSVIINNLINNLNVDIILCKFGKCPPHWRNVDFIADMSRLYYIISGEGRLEINGREYYPKPGQLFLMPQGIKQSYSYINENPFYKYWCHFTIRIGSMNFFDVIKLPHFIEIKDLNHIKDLYLKIISGIEMNDVYGLLTAKAALIDILALYMKSCGYDNIVLFQSAEKGNLESAAAYIEDNLHRNISLEEVAREVYLHPVYFIRIFKKHFGITPIQYIIDRRISKAKELLANTVLSIHEVGESTGFSSPYYFSQTFKKKTGVSPTDYRAMHQTL